MSAVGKKKLKKKWSLNDGNDLPNTGGRFNDFATSEQIDNTLEQEKYTDWIPKEPKSRNQSWLRWTFARNVKLVSSSDTFSPRDGISLRGTTSVTHLESRVFTRVRAYWNETLEGEGDMHDPFGASRLLNVSAIRV